MARPKSEEKVLAILESATHVIAANGLAAPTPLIARGASVAEGTIFRYFPTKDDLLSAVFLHLSRHLRTSMSTSLPARASLERQFESAWNEYIDWGINHPVESVVLNQLSASDRIFSEARAQADAMFPELHALCETYAGEKFGAEGTAFFNSVFFALANTTTQFASRHSGESEAYKALGFRMLWKGLKN
ncbi:TetR/AcrR family transcriptional regulator [Ralstonia solanacearum]|nr:TetR/AcrR family transcriptional regulator [Ralstonia solanacearum]MDC6176154.1 TetR/AcrR family transcriptional regulator [Ralstonia solanacearum]MDC6239526.1 TetR/AcrR family transcriptional regulator [Ralstonia solanacearum]TYZ55438.1 TetR/AcrR family transcriptional regulator [Ralstonia solanacearum]